MLSADLFRFHNRSSVSVLCGCKCMFILSGDSDLFLWLGNINCQERPLSFKLGLHLNCIGCPSPYSTVAQCLTKTAFPGVKCRIETQNDCNSREILCVLWSTSWGVCIVLPGVWFFPHTTYVRDSGMIILHFPPGYTKDVSLWCADTTFCLIRPRPHISKWSCFPPALL